MLCSSLGVFIIVNDIVVSFTLIEVKELLYIFLIIIFTVLFFWDADALKYSKESNDDKCMSVCSLSLLPGVFYLHFISCV